MRRIGNETPVAARPELEVLYTPEEVAKALQDMIAHQTPCMDKNLVFGRVPSEFEKTENPGVIIFEELAPPGSSQGHME